MTKTNLLPKKPNAWTIALGLLLPLLIAGAIAVALDASNPLYLRIAAIPMVIVTIAIAFIREHTKEKDRHAEEVAAYNEIPLNRFHTTVTADLLTQRTYVDTFHRDGNYFKLMLAQFRVKTERRKFEKISQAHYPDTYWIVRALNMWDYFIYVFRAIMRECHDGDEYLTVSIIAFWLKDKSSKDLRNQQGDIIGREEKNFFETNYDKCANAMVLSKRVIIINKDMLVRGQTAANKTEDAEYYANVKRVLGTFLDESKTHERFVNYFYLATDNEYKRLLEEDVPFALIRRADLGTRLCISTYIPDPKAPDREAARDSQATGNWRAGSIAKIGFRICENAEDGDWKRMYKKFDSLFNCCDKEARLTAKQLLTKI